MANSVRNKNFARLIQKELSEIFQRDKRGYLDNAFITNAEVRMSPGPRCSKGVREHDCLRKTNRHFSRSSTSNKKEIRRALGGKKSATRHGLFRSWLSLLMRLRKMHSAWTSSLKASTFRLPRRNLQKRRSERIALHSTTLLPL